MDSIDAIKSLPVERLILVIKTKEGDIRIETTKSGAIMLIKLLREHKKAIKNSVGGLDIEITPKTDATGDDDFILEKFSERFEDISDAIKGAVGYEDDDDVMYM